MILAESELKLLIEEASKGNEDSFRRLYEMLVSRVFSYVHVRLNPKEEVLDCTQQIFIELWKALPRFTFKSGPQFYGFLFTITKRQIIKVRENMKRLPERIVEEDALPADGPARDEGEVRELLDHLGEAEREIVVLHHWSGYTFGEIGEMLSLSETNVRVRHHRAIKTLRTLFETYEK